MTSIAPPQQLIADDRTPSAPLTAHTPSRRSRDGRRIGTRAPTATRAHRPSTSFAGTSGTALPATSGKPDLLDAYTNRTGHRREVIAIRRGDGCVLVVDRDALTLGDRRLVARLDAEEPSENAAVVCAHYLSDEDRGRCRRMSLLDLFAGPSAGEPPIDAAPGEVENPLATRLAGDGIDADTHGRYRLWCRQQEPPLKTAELCWCHEQPGRAQSTPMGLREVIGALESYEPVCRITLAALARYRDEAHVSTAVLHMQLERIRESPIVLNRKLRQAVLAAAERRDLSMSEIALRCGRIKRDCRGRCSGETSWLARRVGLMPESGGGRPTPWVHSDVLALIARNGLGMSPREVELG